MSDGCRGRLVDQFSYRGEHADVWRYFELFLDTDAFLNLGYSRWYQPHVPGSQRRLVSKVGAETAARLPNAHGSRLLEVGCGRGGPAIHLTEEFGFDVTGVDLVPYNVAVARNNARERAVPATFVVGDAAALPFDDRSFRACTAIDAVVYVPEKCAVFEELERVVADDGIVVVSDLVVGSGGIDVVEAFADAWDMPPISSLEQYRRTIGRAGLTTEEVENVSANSIDRFRKWSGLYLSIVDRTGGIPERLLERRGLDAETITEQIRRAHEALPHLEHVIVYARRE